VIKVKLSPKEQIEHMKSKGITFSIVSEDEAHSFLMDNNYPGLFSNLDCFSSNH